MSQPLLAMLSNTSIRTRLLWLVFSVLIPLSALLAWALVRDEERARDAVYLRMTTVAADRASFIGQYFSDQQAVLDRLSQRPDVQRGDPANCDSLLMSYPKLHPEFSNLSQRRVDGTLVCTFLPNTSAQVSPTFLGLTEAVARTGKYNVSPVMKGPASGRQVVVSVQPVMTGSGAVTGVIFLGNDLLKLNGRIFSGMPDGLTVGVFDENETFALRSDNPEKWIGQPIAPANRGKYNQQPTGSATLVAVDGVRRLYSWAMVPGLGWRVSAGVREDLAMAPYWQSRNRTLAAIGGIVLLALLLAYRLAQSVNRPVNALAGVTRRMAQDDYSARAAVSGPRELRALATQFNAMLDVRSKALADLRDSETRWKFAIEGAGDGLYDWDVAAGRVYYSPRWKAMAGYTEDEIGTGLDDWTRQVHPDDLPEAMAALQPHMDGATAQYTSEHRVRCKDGRHIWVLDRGLVVTRDAAGKPLRVVGTRSDITLRKQEQEALRRSEDQYRELLNVSPVPCALNDNVLKINFVNRAFVSTFGYTLDDIPTLDDWWPKAYPDPAYRTWVGEEWQRRMAAAFSSGNPFEPLELRIRAKDGGVRTAMVYAAGLSNPQANLHLVVLVDITERKNAEVALREADQRFRDLTDSTDGIVWEADAITFTFDSISANVERILGYPSADWLRPGFWASHIHPDDHDYAVQYCVACTGRLENHDFEYRFITADGRTVWLRDIVKVVSEDGKPRWLRGLMIDITQSRKDAETLRTNTDLLEYTQAAAKVGGWELTIATGHLYWTAETYRIHETNPAEFNPTVDAGVGYFLPESRAQIIEALGLAIGQGLGYSLELQTYTTKGSLIDVFTTCTVSLKDGKPVKLTGIFQDITEQKAVQRRIEAANLELVRSNADLEQFAYVASHDLQEPLRSVSSSVQLLRRRYEGALDERAQEFIEHAVGGVKRMQAVIDDLLAYSRVASGPRVFKPADLELALEVALENLGRSITANHATITHDPLPTVQANPMQIGQVLQNLIGNALKFRGDKPAVVHIGAVKKDAEWIFSVGDQGIGIAPEYFERVFKLFQRLHTRTEYEGTGIGLTICHKIVERHGGRIWVESAPGQGSTFFFTLPVEVAAV